MRTHVKNSSSQQAVRAIIALLPRISDENLVRLTHLGQLLTNDDQTLRAIAKVRHYLQTPGHPARELFRRVLDRLPAKRRVRLFETLFNGAWFIGNNLRNQAEADLGFRPPFIMILSPTYNCNLRCKGCYTLGYGLKPELPLEVVDRLLNECEKLGIYFVTILGGEPFVYPHLFTMLERHPSIFFQVYTNGTLMTREKAKRLAELGNTAVVISIEGDEIETDSWRGKDVFFIHSGQWFGRFFPDGKPAAEKPFEKTGNRHSRQPPDVRIGFLERRRLCSGMYCRRPPVFSCKCQG
jgi:hypothetical protein